MLASLPDPRRRVRISLRGRPRSIFETGKPRVLQVQCELLLTLPPFCSARFSARHLDEMVHAQNPRGAARCNLHSASLEAVRGRAGRDCPEDSIPVLTVEPPLDEFLIASSMHLALFRISVCADPTFITAFELHRRSTASPLGPCAVLDPRWGESLLSTWMLWPAFPQTPNKIGDGAAVAAQLLRGAYRFVTTNRFMPALPPASRSPAEHPLRPCSDGCRQCNHRCGSDYRYKGCSWIC